MYRNVLIQTPYAYAWNYHYVIIGKGEWDRVTIVCAQVREPRKLNVLAKTEYQQQQQQQTTQLI